MLAYQRVQTLTNDFATGNALLNKGLDSSTVIAGMSQQAFAKKSGLSYPSSRSVYPQAQKKATASAHYFEAVRNAMFGTFNELAVSNQHSLYAELHKEIDGLDDLFESQHFCECEHCRSIFSPAAYFTDLMYFIQKNVSKKLPEDHPIRLKNRRPDLWQLKLTCANTTTEIPYLQVVNEVLEAYIEASRETEETVYEIIGKANVSTTLPVNILLEELRLYISHFLPLYDVYKVLKQPKPIQLSEKLQLSEDEVNIIASINPTEAHRRFGDEVLTDMNVQLFLKYAGIKREQLTDLLATRFTSEIPEVSILLLKDPTDIQKYSEVLQGLTEENLDVMHRYLRLWKKTKWTIREFDLVLNSLKAAGLLPNLEATDDAGVPRFLILADLVIIQESLRCTVEELAAIVHQIPLVSVKEHQKSLFERLFNLEKIFDGAADVTLPADKTQDKITPLLLAGLGISESDLGMLFGLLGLDTAVDQQINKAIISRLFRQVRIARGLKWSMEELTGASQILLAGAPVNQISQIRTLIDFQQWLQQTPLKLPDLLLILLGIESSARQFEHDNASTAAAVLEIQTNPEPDKKELLLLHLQRVFNLTWIQLREEFLPKLVALDINGAGIDTALNAPQPHNLNDFNDLTALMRTLERLILLFEKLGYSPETISFFIKEYAVFGITNLKSLTLQDIRLADFYRSLLVDTDQEENIRESLIQYQADGNFTDESLAVFANSWKQPPGLLRSLTDSFEFSSTALEAVQFLRELNELSRILGLEGPNLVKLTANTNEGLPGARDAALGAFSAKYPEEDVRLEKLEPYIDKINTIKRDALCDYIIGLKEPHEFEDRADLYYYFLLDVEMSGCFRTSRIVAAISSLQLYVHRVLVNLEQTAPGVEPYINVLQRIDDDNLEKFKREWEWRKNYRVWEANRKVFLYPENWIDPTLRDNKTHLFKELEDELLQEKITMESAEAAYKKYLAQFSELSKLRFAGAYYQSKTVINYLNLRTRTLDGFYVIKTVYFQKETDESKYYLFARTNMDPYQYYYRTYTHYNQVWGHWIKMELAIEAAEISALVHRGKLYVFWTEVQRKELKNITDGDATPGGAVFKVHTKYSFLNENGNWSPPQRVYAGFMHRTDNEIFDRVFGYPNGLNEPEKEKSHDYIFEQFERWVFRKPFVSIDYGNNMAPLKLSYIWSQNKRVPAVEYYLYEQPLPVWDGWIQKMNDNVYIKIFVTIPYTEFLIIDNQFGSASVTKIVYIKLIENGNTLVFLVSAKITLLSTSNCIIYYEGKIPVYGHKIPIYFNFSVSVNSSTPPIDILASHFNLSLSQNRLTNATNTDIINVNDVVNIGHSSALFLQKEYNTAFSENGNFDHYIENGSSSFTSFERKITQSQAGDGSMLIPGNNGNQIPVSTTTILTDELTEILSAKGLEQFLSLQTQTLANANGGQFDMKGAYGEYYWELFFHIPFLIADHLNANQKFKEAKWWYERIFDPSSKELPGDQTPSDHNWQFREFRHLDIEKLKDILTNGAAIDAYTDDPFDPHAIARLRTNAYQKAIVMKYIDNLLDWGDHLFAQDDSESINEALMLYVLAKDILGERPVKLGQCETADENTLTYEVIEGAIHEGSEFLIVLENAQLIIEQDYENNILPVKNSKHLATTLQNLNLRPPPNRLLQIAESVKYIRVTDAFKGVLEPAPANGENPGVTPATEAVPWSFSGNRVAKYDDLVNQATLNTDGLVYWADADAISTDDLVEDPPQSDPALDLVNEGMLVYCVPHNADLLAYWDRVEDRLYKIRHCMNISGIRRSLALFQPPIDPGLLVRARALGLSLEDIYNLTTTPVILPLYRFEYLLEKAKQFTQTVQGFGNALLSAQEKKDVEELTLLRAVQEQNILKLTRDIKKHQIKEAQHQYQSMVEAIVNVQNRIDYYQGLLLDPLNVWEITQQVTKHTGNLLMAPGNILLTLSSMLELIPKIIGFSNSTGGQENAESVAKKAQQIQNSADLLQKIADSAGLEASFKRREQEWNFQLTLARQEKVQLDQQLLAAEIRQNIAEKDLEIHEKTMEQAKEIHSFYKDKFTNLGLYNFLSSNLARIYRQAYQMALVMAQKAERAFQYERDADVLFLGIQHFDTSRAGLLAGERLLMELQNMEVSYLDMNKRDFEITKHISLKLLNPLALLLLKAEGTCEFEVPEWLFDLDCPGHYMRRIKSAALSIPAIAGPYTSINCTLTLLSSTIRKSDSAEGEYERQQDQEKRFIDYGPIQPIVTSNSQNDNGLFETNFRDERYLPFEGQGAESTWKLELPPNLRQFDYNTITDVILHLRYTARPVSDPIFRQKATDYIKEVMANANESGMARLFSIKQDFANDWHRFHTGDGNLLFTILKEQLGYLPQASEVSIDTEHLQLLSITESGLDTYTLGAEEIIHDFAQINTLKKSSVEIRKGLIDKGAKDIFLLVYYSFEL